MTDDRFGPDRYSSDVLADFSRRRRPAPPPSVEAEDDLVIEWTDTGYCGAVVGIEGRNVQLEDYSGGVRVFPLGPGFLLEGKPVTLVAPTRKATSGMLRSASGSVAVTDHVARVARASRIFVEGRHDAELVEKVWGHDLRVEGVVVEYLEGIDDLEAIIRDFRPSAERRVGVLVDHLVPGSKEQRIADAVAKGPHGAHVLVVGHPYVDIWQSVKPARLGLEAWPTVPRNIEWKKGICAALGWPHADQADIARAWQRILGTVRSYADLEPVLLGRVEHLIDFVTEGSEGAGPVR
ncbi:DUF3097 domain-containing protein [Salinibacterium sp. SYSU T00001]|uniref:DUF3097 domain-containing protein n=1 Tax=Homoserinimonas sedimenticola TaxID=2986805 RepID=UPI00223650A7|nr:DUF3097 domain-containing protein [Salinibacterium sedimenticola]MCW4384770.1 DUF3097 domain-containing protein [Salinibacterium sedimenticola]